MTAYEFLRKLLGSLNDYTVYGYFNGPLREKLKKFYRVEKAYWLVHQDDAGRGNDPHEKYGPLTQEVYDAIELKFRAVNEEVSDLLEIRCGRRGNFIVFRPTIFEHYYLPDEILRFNHVSDWLRDIGVTIEELQKVKPSLPYLEAEKLVQLS